MAQEFTLGTFGDALAALKQGRKVRNREWDSSETFLEIADPDPKIQVVTPYTMGRWYPQPADLVSNSWETVE